MSVDTRKPIEFEQSLLDIACVICNGIYPYIKNGTAHFTEAYGVLFEETEKFLNLSIKKANRNVTKLVINTFDMALIAVFASKLPEPENIEKLMTLLAERDISLFKAITPSKINNLSYRIVLQIERCTDLQLSKSYQAALNKACDIAFPQAITKTVTKLEQLQNVIRTPENEMTSRSGISAHDIATSLHVDDCFNFTHIEGLKGYWLEEYSIDGYSGYGTGALYYKDMLVGAFYNTSKKGDMGYLWVDKEAYDTMRQIVLSLTDGIDKSEEYILSDESLSKVMDNYFILGNADHLEKEICEYMEKPHTVIKVLGLKPNRYIRDEIIIKCNVTGKEVQVNVEDVLFPIRTVENMEFFKTV
jgi:hypothetical protein